MQEALILLKPPGFRFWWARRDSNPQSFKAWWFKHQMYAISITDPKPSHPYSSIILYGRGEWNRTTIKRVKVFRLAIGLRPYHGGERGIRTLGAFILYRLATCCLTHSAISPNNLAGKAGIEPTSSRLTAVSFA